MVEISILESFRSSGVLFEIPQWNSISVPKSSLS